MWSCHASPVLCTPFACGHTDGTRCLKAACLPPWGSTTSHPSFRCHHPSLRDTKAPRQPRGSPLCASCLGHRRAVPSYKDTRDTKSPILTRESASPCAVVSVRLQRWAWEHVCHVWCIGGKQTKRAQSVNRSLSEVRVCTCGRWHAPSASERLGIGEETAKAL